MAMQKQQNLHSSYVCTCAGIPVRMYTTQAQGQAEVLAIKIKKSGD